VLSPSLADHIRGSPLEISNGSLEASFGEYKVSCSATMGSQIESCAGNAHDAFEDTIITCSSHSEPEGMMDDQFSYKEEDFANLGIDAQQFRPMYEEYILRLSDADLRREAYSRLVWEYGKLLEALENSEKLSHELLQEDREILSNFHVKEAKLLKELKEVDHDVQRLRLQLYPEARPDEGEEPKSDILSVSNGLEKTNQRDCTVYLELIQQLESTGLLDIAESLDESQPSPNNLTDDTFDPLGIGEIRLEVTGDGSDGGEDPWNLLLEPNDEWLHNLMDIPLSSTEPWQDTSGFDMPEDFNHRYEPTNQTDNVKHLELSDFQEETHFIDPCLTFMTQLDMADGIWPDLKGTSIPVLDGHAMTGFTDFQSLSTLDSKSLESSKQILPTPTYQKTPLSPTLSPPSPQTAFDFSPPASSASSLNEFPKKCNYCNRTFSRPSDLRSAPSFPQNDPFYYPFSTMRKFSHCKQKTSQVSH
jgi:hypothetical protein